MRTALAAASATAALLAPLAGPAGAASAVVMECEFTYDWDGAWALCWTSGVYAGSLAVQMPTFFEFQVGHRIGVIESAQTPDGTLSWTRVGPVGVLTVHGAEQGNGAMAFSTPAPGLAPTETVVITFESR